MEIVIGNSLDYVLINLIDLKKIHENWIYGEIKLKRELLAYKSPVNLQVIDLENFNMAISQLIDNRIENATFYCLEEWLNIIVSKVDNLGHFNLKAVIKNIDTQTKVEINFEITLQNIIELKMQIDNFLKNLNFPRK